MYVVLFHNCGFRSFAVLILRNWKNMMYLIYRERIGRDCFRCFGCDLVKEESKCKWLHIVIPSGSFSLWDLCIVTVCYL